MIQLNIQEPYKSLILSGEKTIEGRLNKGKFSDLKIGDILQFEDTGEVFEVIDLSHYRRFQIMLEQEGLKHVLPGIQSIDTGVAIYHQFYTPAQEAEFGVIPIHIKRKKI